MSKSIASKIALALAVSFTASCGDPGAANSFANRPANNVNSANNASAAAPANHEAEVKKIMTDMAAALAKNDADAVSKYYSDDYHLITPQGVDQTKAARIADMKSGTAKFDAFAYENVSVRSYGDTAVAITDVRAKGTSGGQPVASNIKATLVFHKGKDGWKVVSGQATPVTAATASSSPASNTSANANANANANR